VPYHTKRHPLLPPPTPIPAFHRWADGSLVAFSVTVWWRNNGKRDEE
jgi:hypothetical protein